MEDYTLVIFLKFGQEDHMRDLFYEGKIYMNSIQYFRTIEDNELRGDLYEGISRIKNYPPGIFKIPSINYKGEYLRLQIRESYKAIFGNIFSLYCISSHGWKNPKDVKIDEKIKRFGSHCVLIKDNVKFLSLLENKLKELKMKFRHGFIEYYDKNQVDREISLFEKPNEFEYQKEFRFHIDRFSEEPLSFNIGSLTDIAELHSSNDVVDTLKTQAAK